MDHVREFPIPLCVLSMPSHALNLTTPTFGSVHGGVDLNGRQSRQLLSSNRCLRRLLPGVGASVGATAHPTHLPVPKKFPTLLTSSVMSRHRRSRHHSRQATQAQYCHYYYYPSSHPSMYGTPRFLAPTPRGSQQPAFPPPPIGYPYPLSPMVWQSSQNRHHGGSSNWGSSDRHRSSGGGGGRNQSSQSRNPGPPQRPIVPVYTDHPLKNAAGSPYPSFTLLCYNVLAQDLLNKNLYLYENSPKEYLQWEKRAEKLVKELLDSKADILCLQEVDAEYYDSVYLPHLESNGYAGFFKKRTGDKCDGCALFYLASKLELVEHKAVEFQKRVRPLDRDNVGILARFRLKLPSSSSEFCIATTHILFNPKAGDVKLAQLCLLLAELHTMASSGEGDQVIPAILCGDLNSLPHSPLIKFVERSSLDYSRMFAEDVAGYQSHRSRRHRTLPIPILNKSLSIGQDCRYKSTLSSHDVIDLTAMSPTPVSPKNLLQPEFNGGIDLNEFPSLLGLPQSSEPTVKQSTQAPPIFIDNVWSTVLGLNHVNLLSVQPPPPPNTSAPNTLHSSAQPPPPNTARTPPPPNTLYSSAQAPPPPNASAQAPPPPPNTLHSSAQTLHPSNILHSTSPPNTSAQTLPPPNSTHSTNQTASAQTASLTSMTPSSSIQITSPPSATKTSRARSGAIISHPFHFVSAYPIPSRRHSSSVVTTFHGKAFEMVDYIFFTPLKSNKGLQLVYRKALPSTHTLNQIGPQPNKHFPSDHLYLQVEFQIVD